jgi:hypothetical protein
MGRRFLVLLALACAIALGVSGCTAIIIGGPTVPTRTPTLAPTPGPGTPTVAPTTGPGTPSPTPSGPTPTPVTGPKGSATLTKAPTGQAHLTYDPNTQNLTIQTTLNTLVPNSPHMMNIRTGNCISTGPIIVTLPNVTADAAGNVNTSSSQMVQPATQPSSGWYIEVTNGIGSSTYDTLNLVCANITSVQGGAGQPQTSNVQFTQGVGPSMNASGNATFTLANNQVTVKLTVSGLEPGSQHAAFVSQGTCQNQSNQRVFQLQPLTGDNSGNASSTTVIGPVQSTPTPSTAWYVIVTRGTTLSSFLDAAPITCGPVVVTQ